MDIGTKIREIRKRSGLTIKELAEKAGVSYLTMQRIETDKISPSVTVLSEIAQCLKYPIESLLHGERKALVHIPKSEQSVLKAMRLTLRLLAPKGIIADNVSVSLGKAEKGRFIDRHKHEGFEFAYIIKGKCIFRYGKKNYELHEGDVIYFDSREWHSVTALEPQEFFGIQFYSK